VKVIVPLPARDFDPTEVAVPWRVLTDAGHEVLFATPDGKPGAADPIMLSGEGLDPWGFLPLLRKLPLIGLSLRANGTARAAYRAMLADSRFQQPLRWDQLQGDAYDGLLLPGGHAKGVREYLESPSLQAFVATFFDADKPVAAICHGVVLAARSVSGKTGRSVLHGRRTTALTWQFENTAWNLTRFFARFWDPGYYRTYAEEAGEPRGYRGVQQEVTRALARPEDFLDVPADDPGHFRKASGLFRDSPADTGMSFVVRDRRYVSARWPGDAHAFAKAFVEVLAD
jgi:putative intracellular protease/amidase